MVCGASILSAVLRPAAGGVGIGGRGVRLLGAGGDLDVRLGLRLRLRLCLHRGFRAVGAR